MVDVFRQFKSNNGVDGVILSNRVGGGGIMVISGRWEGKEFIPRKFHIKPKRVLNLSAALKQVALWMPEGYTEIMDKMETWRLDYFFM